MESDRKREILAAEARFQRRQQLSGRLAAAGVYVIGPLNPGPDQEPQIAQLVAMESESREGRPAE